jgi:hypothetical protein
MKRQKNCVVYGYKSKGGGKFFLRSLGFQGLQRFTENREEAITLSYDVAWSNAKREGLYVESR